MGKGLLRRHKESSSSKDIRDSLGRYICNTYDRQRVSLQILKSYERQKYKDEKCKHNINSDKWKPGEASKSTVKCKVRNTTAGLLEKKKKKET